jgi:hypothetical protein
MDMQSPKTMISKTRIAATLAAFAAAGFAAGSAQAQTYGAPYGQQPPLYPYAVSPQQPYAVEVSPGVYVIQRPAAARAYPSVNPSVKCMNCARKSSNPNLEQAAPASDRPHKPADRALIEELRSRTQVKRTVVNTTKTVREAPVVRETTRVVDDPPRVVERRHVVEDAPAPTPSKRRAQAAATDSDSNKAASPDDTKQRVIRAEAEVTILGPDRMSIRLFRKRHGADAKARDED